MSGEAVLRPRCVHLESLRHQLADWPYVSGRLVVMCSEPVASTAFDRDLKLVVRGLVVDDAAVLKALRFAVRRLGTQEIVVVGSAGCGHTVGTHEEVGGDAAAKAPHRLFAGVLRAHAALDSAKRAVKRAVHALRRPEAQLSDVSVCGLLWSDVGGVFYHYGVEETGFRLVPSPADAVLPLALQ